MFVPIAILPGWIQLVSKAVFISLSADLLRASLKAAPAHDFWGRLGMVLLLGRVSFLIGRAVLFAVLRQMRVTGELATV